MKTILPPGPKGSLLLGNTKQFAVNSLDFVKHCMQAYGSICYTKIAFRDFYMLFSPENINHVLQVNHKNYVKSFAYKGLRTFLGNGLLTSEGDFWLKQRRIAQPAFHRERLSKLVHTMSSCTTRLTDHWEEEYEKGQPIDIGLVMRNLTADIVTYSLFSTQVDTHAQRIASEVLPQMLLYANEKMKNPFKPPLFIPTAKNRAFKSSLQYIDEVIYGIIDSRLEDQERKDDLLGMLMEMKDEDTGEKMNRRQLRDEVMTIYIAGQETTANAISFILYLLSKKEGVYQKLMQEINTELGEKTPVFEDLPKLEYTMQVIKESMRLYPPAWAVSRQALEQDEIEGYQIPKGATVFLSIYALHHHPKYWEQPEAFIPERFDKKNAANLYKGAYLPFGIGPRLCIGNNFALMEMQIVLSILLRKFKFTPDASYQLELKTPMTLAPKKPLMMKVSSVEQFVV